MKLKWQPIVIAPCGSEYELVDTAEVDDVLLGTVAQQSYSPKAPWDAYLVLYNGNSGYQKPVGVRATLKEAKKLVDEAVAEEYGA